MKKMLFSLLVMSCLVTLSACSKTPTDTNQPEANDAAQEETAETPSKTSNLKRYGIESGMITFELSGVKSGTKTLYWDQWGMREATYTESEISAGGLTISENSVSIMDGDWIYNFKDGEKTGTKVQNTILADIAKGSGNNDLGEIGYQMLSRMGGVKTGTESVAGQECDVYQLKSVNTTSCVWKAITLKVVSNIAGFGVNETATSIKTGPVPAEKLEVPSEITFTSLGNVMEKMKNN